MATKNRSGQESDEKPIVTRGDEHALADSHNVEPQLPHEADQASSNQGSDSPEQARTGRQAKADVDRGLVDTDRAPVMDKLYRKEFDRPRKPRV